METLELAIIFANVTALDRRSRSEQIVSLRFKALHLWRAKRAARGRASERRSCEVRRKRRALASHSFLVPRTRVVAFRVPLSRDSNKRACSQANN